MVAPDSVIDLVKKFEDNISAYKSVKYNETTVRQEFIDPFFKALGWDVNNERNIAPQYRDVILEDSIKVGSKTKAPDYSFTLSGRRIFFLEAKKPAVDIINDKDPAFQLKRYAWSGKLALSVLTDFEDLAIYEAKTRPKRTDNTKIGRVKLYNYKDYIEKWDEIYNLLSKEAILNGSFDKFAESTSKKGSSQVDDEFLKEIENWRLLLARNIALRNPEITIEDLNYAVQLTVDRIIFLRMAEDRGFEPYEQLLKLLEHEKIYEEFGKLCKYADEKYNSGIFHFKEEKNISQAADTFSLKLSIDNSIFKEIFKNLYYPHSPYEFSVLSPEILGNVYEQFLGKIIRLTPSHQAKIEEKPEVKKAGGVFYTPQYIVDYIVENTVGKLIENKTPNQVKKIKILDPACGSGSFLLGAYKYLLKWHIDYYSKLEKPPKDTIYESKKGEHHLTIQKKKEILLNNIYGVDVDKQAVEVTKLSLLLKVLEDENKDVLEAQQKLIQERVLPFLGNNIKCGNSLIGTDILEDDRITQEEIAKINPFDWEEEFSDIFENGGFDAVIGNPPYLRIQGLQEFYGNQIDYLKDKYESAVKRFDLYVLFIEKGFILLNKNGLLSYICPHKFINSDFGSGIRKFLKNSNSLNNFVNFNNNLIFKSASTYTCILTLKNDNNSKFKYYEFENMSNKSIEYYLKNLNDNNFAVYDSNFLDFKPWILMNKEIKDVLDKLNENKSTLGDIFEKIFQGIVTGIDEIYLLEKVKEDEDTVTVLSNRENKDVILEKGAVKPLLKGEDVHRYESPEFKYYCIYPYKLVDSKTVILEENEFKELYPLTFKYLEQYKLELKNLRVKFKTNPKYWYSCHRGRSIELFERDRIITPEITLGCNLTLTSPEIYHNTKVYSFVPPTSSPEKIEYWLGVLNSRILWWYMSNTSYVLRGGYFTFNTKYLKPFPLKEINFKDSNEVKIYENIINLVKNNLTLKNDLLKINTPHEKKLLEKQIKATDKKIDKLVYELYNLTEEEITIIENSIN